MLHTGSSMLQLINLMQFDFLLIEGRDQADSKWEVGCMLRASMYSNRLSTGGRETCFCNGTDLSNKISVPFCVSVDGPRLMPTIIPLISSFDCRLTSWRNGSRSITGIARLKPIASQGLSTRASLCGWEIFFKIQRLRLPLSMVATWMRTTCNTSKPSFLLLHVVFKPSHVSGLHLIWGAGSRARSRLIQ